jgi:hypothetical protein
MIGMRITIRMKIEYEVATRCSREADLGVTWTSPTVLRYDGFSPPGINWAEVVRITDPAATAGMVAAGQVPINPGGSRI